MKINIKLFFCIAISGLISASSFAGLDDARLIVNLNDEQWRIECIDGSTETVSTDNILNNEVCGDSARFHPLCIDVAKANINYRQYDTVGEITALTSACSSGNRGMGSMLQKMIDNFNYRNYDTNSEMVDLISSAAPGLKSGSGCLDIAFSNFNYRNYDTLSEMTTLAASCGPYRSQRQLNCLTSTLQGLNYRNYDTLSEMTLLVQSCQ